MAEKLVQLTGRKLDRDALGRFVKGHSSASNGGRKKLPEELRTAFRAEGPRALDVLVAVMTDPEARTADRIRAAEIILDRGYGRPAQAVEVSDGEGGGVIIVPDVVLIGEPSD